MATVRSQFYSINVDRSLRPSTSTNGNHSSKSDKLVALKYSQKPDPSSSALPASLYASNTSTKDPTWTLEYGSTKDRSQGGNSSRSQTFTGTQESKALDLVLVWDNTKKAYILTTIDSTISLEPSSNNVKDGMKATEKVEKSSKSQESTPSKAQRTPSTSTPKTSLPKEKPIAPLPRSSLSSSRSNTVQLQSSGSEVSKSGQRSSVGRNKDLDYEVEEFGPSRSLSTSLSSTPSGSVSRSNSKSKLREEDEGFDKEDREVQNEDIGMEIVKSSNKKKESDEMDLDVEEFEPRRGRTLSRGGNGGVKELEPQIQINLENDEKSKGSPNQNQSSNSVHSLDTSSVALRLRDKQKARLNLTGAGISSSNSSLERPQNPALTPSASPAPQALTPLLPRGELNRSSNLDSDSEMHPDDEEKRGEGFGLGLGLELEMERRDSKGKTKAKEIETSEDSSMIDSNQNPSSVKIEIAQTPPVLSSTTPIPSLPSTPTPINHHSTSRGNSTSLSRSTSLVRNSSSHAAAEWQPNSNNQTSYYEEDDGFDDGSGSESGSEDEDDEEEEEDESENENENQENYEGLQPLEDGGDGGGFGDGDLDEDDLLEDFAAELEDSLMNQSEEIPQEVQVKKGKPRGRPKGSKGKK